MTEYAKRSDANQAVLIEYLRALGFSVESLHRVGGGVPDLLVGGFGPCPHCGRSFPQNYLIEVKKEHGKLNPKQLNWHGKWLGQKATARAETDIDYIIGRSRPPVIWRGDPYFGIPAEAQEGSGDRPAQTPRDSNA